MTPTQYRAAIKALGLSQERAGVWLGISPRTSQGYARCRTCSMERVRAYFQDHYCFGKYRMTKRQVTNFALLRDRRLVNRNAINGLVRVGFAFYDSIMDCYRCDPLVLAEFERGMAMSCYKA